MEVNGGGRVLWEMNIKQDVCILNQYHIYVVRHYLLTIQSTHTMHWYSLFFFLFGCCRNLICYQIGRLQSVKSNEHLKEDIHKTQLTN